MWKSYLTSAFRSLKNNRGFAAINILGLALGLTAFLLIVFYVSDELSYDRFNTKADRIYRVNEDLKFGNNEVLYAVVMSPLAQALKDDFPEVEDAVRLRNAWSARIKKGNVTIRENKLVYADPSLFQVFTLPMIEGNPLNALKEPNTVVLTESTARKYFNSTQVLGRTLLLDDHLNYKVTGVISDLPKTSHFNFDFFLSMSSLPESRENKWLRSNFNTYVLLKEGADVQQFEGALNGFLQRHSGAEVQAELKTTYSAFEKSGNYFRINLIPLK
ncbi:ABC transporter permease, partial [Arcticibacter svalbardensis]|uniref:ABC transporter permease n=1 Tax=Arcticibacter svalbardensis TaxID=1288027 RepID=UPI00058AFBE1